MSFEFYNTSMPTGYTEEMEYRAGVEADITAINGTLTSLNGSVTALEEVTGSVDLSGLTTTDKTSLVNAINENVTNINTNTGNISSNASNISALNTSVSQREINIKDYNIAGVDLTDYTTEIQTMFSSVTDHTTIKIPKGTYSFNALSIDSKKGIKLIGNSKTGSILKLTELTSTKFEFKGCDDIQISNLTIIIEDNLNTDKFRFSENDLAVGCSNIKITDCIFKNVTNNKDLSGTITFWKNCYNIEISNCRFEDINIPLKFDNNGTAVTSGYLRIFNNMFIGDGTSRAKRGIRVMGTGERAGTNCFIMNNYFEKFDYSCMELYHIQAWTIHNNSFDDCKALVSQDYTGTSPVESAICWLDTMGSPIRGNNSFQGNSFTNCVGICIYMEEVTGGVISGNRFINITKRPSGINTYSDGTDTFVSNGSHCIIAVGAVNNLLVEGNNFLNVARVMLVCRKFAPSIVGGYYTEYIYIKNNKIACTETAIDLKEKLTYVLVKGNIAVGTGSTYPFIEYEKGATQDINTLMLSDNEARDFITFYKRAANYGNGRVLNNYLYCTTGGATFFQCDYRTNYAINNNVFATSQSAFTIVNS